MAKDSRRIDLEKGTMENVEKVTEAILRDVKTLEDISNANGNQLSEIALRMSINKVFIGQALAELDYDLNQKTLARKIEWGNKFAEFKSSEVKLTIRECEIMSDEAVNEMVKEEIGLARGVNILKNLRRDVSDTITTIQTRIGQLKSEMVEINSTQGH